LRQAHAPQRNEENTMESDSTLRDERINTQKPHKDEGQPLTANDKSKSPRMPHERDESFDSQEDHPRDVIKQAHDDIAQGQMDTDRRGMPGVEEVERHKPGNAQEEIPASSRMPASTPKK
jgi:phage terminase large subunit GpA-like protein